MILQNKLLLSQDEAFFSQEDIKGCGGGVSGRHNITVVMEL